MMAHVLAAGDRRMQYAYGNHRGGRGYATVATMARWLGRLTRYWTRLARMADRMGTRGGTSTLVESPTVANTTRTTPGDTRDGHATTARIHKG